MNFVEKKFFTIDEVNQLIPQIDYHFRKLLESKRAMAKASRRLEREGMSPQSILADLGPSDPRPEIGQLQEVLKAHYESFKNHVSAIEALGGRIKDFELGRVEFSSRLGDRVVPLIWQLGVTDSVHAEEPEKPVVQV